MGTLPNAGPSRRGPGGGGRSVELWVNRNFTATALIFPGYGACAELEEEENEGNFDGDP